MVLVSHLQVIRGVFFMLTVFSLGLMHMTDGYSIQKQVTMLTEAQNPAPADLEYNNMNIKCYITKKLFIYDLRAFMSLK